MKYTNGKKADSSAFPFKIEQSSAVSDSPNKFNWEKIGKGALTAGATGLQIGGGLGGLVLGGAIKRQVSGVAADEKKYEDVLEAEGLKRNFWGKLGFGGGNSQARAARIKELQEQDQMGIDRERIESRGGVTAGP